MRNFDKLLQESSTIHGHHCAGQVLGVRMAMLGCREVGIDEPKGCKKLVVYVEMDRCATDAMQAVTGCSLGKRTLKFLDYGKMAATFVNTETGKAVRVLAKDDARALTPRFAPGAATPREAQKQAYRVMPEDTLFSWSPVALRMAPQEMPGYRGERVQCAVCGEGINFRREVEAGGRILCIPCAQGGIISNGNGVGIRSSPKILLIVGYKKVGKTTLIENLIPELSRRGYRVGTVKHHHSDIPAAVDTAGTDTWRHRQAGASSVALATPTDIAVFRSSSNSLGLDQLVSALGALDIVLVEGFHDEPRAKIEVLSDAIAEPLCKTDPRLLALVASYAHETPVPSFAPNSIKPLVDLIEKQLLKL
ncbi:MAG TPA: molybdopterin-guanine dinucleotide biosynthesis protein B [Candidatus Binatia bacterium]|nr:molybdopterin-guanine dinucleotide biosynthesis protein B [Candidatus Binatia bacterium]